MVVTTSCGQAAFASGFEVSRVDGRVLVVPIDDERRGLHRDGGSMEARVLWRLYIDLHVEMHDWLGE
jgi:hypothetical protein